MQTTFQMTVHGGRFFAVIGEGNWLLSTLATRSCGDRAPVTIGDREFDCPSSYLEVTATRLSEMTGYPTAGMIGADIMSEFDVVFDAAAHQVTFAEESVDIDGTCLEADLSWVIPTVTARINGIDRRLGFDSSAPISLLLSDELTASPPAGMVSWSFLTLHSCQCETYWVDVMLADTCLTLRCGFPPEPLESILRAMKTDGIISHEFLLAHKVGFFPRRQQLVFV